MKRGLAACLALLISFTVTADRAKPVKRYEASFLNLFDTVTTIVGYSESREAFAAQARFIHDQLLEYHQLYDIYRDYEGLANLKTVNDQACVSPVKVDRRIIGLLLTAKELYRQTDGKTNIALGSVLAVWHDYRATGVDDPSRAALPPMKLLREKARHADIDCIVIDEAASTVFLPDPDMRLDVGAAAKGYAAQRVCESARAHGISNLLVSVGGNVCAIGSMDGLGKPWRVGIQNPDAENGQRYLCKVALADQALVTSGGYQRYYTVDGVRYPHIIDPETLMPARYFAAVSVLARDSGRADALSTALCCMPLEEGRALVESLPETEALWVFEDGGVVFSSGFGRYLAG